MKTGTKKSGLLTGLLVVTAFAASAIQVTYQVNMGMQIALGNFHPAADTVFVSGNFSSTNWEDTATDGSTGYILTPVAGNTNLYTGTFNMADLSAGNTEQHKFVINPGGNFSALDWELPYSTGTGNRSFVVPATATNLPAVYFNDQSPPVPFPFIAGVDFSDLQLYTDEGYVYKDGGKVEDGFSILTNHGINCVDLRIWTGTDALVKTNNPFNYTNNLTYTVPLAVRVKNAGLQFMLDFHYSDTWADPGHQFIPSEWTNNTTLPANLTNLVQQIYNYSSNTIAVFAASNAMPDYVQVGNEITAGMLWPVGEVSGSDNTSWSQLGQLMKAAIQGIQDAAGTKMPKIVVHIDRGGDWATTEWFFDNLRRQSVPFDIIGQSYYWNYQGALTNVITCLTNAAMRYGKPVLINETSFPWSYYTTNILGFPPTTNGQVEYMVALAQVVKSVPDRLGAGIIWWGAELQNDSSIFDYNGNVLPVAGVFRQMVVPVALNPSLTGSALTLQWPLSGAGMTLMTTTNLTPPAAWLAVTNAVQNTGTWFGASIAAQFANFGTNAVQNTGTWFGATLPVDSSQSRFYRLQSN